MAANQRQMVHKGATVIFLSEVFQRKSNWDMNMIIQHQDILVGMAAVVQLVEFVLTN